ncbi:hypothetical protein FSST1_012694 [Fusarium sambucinum]
MVQILRGKIAFAALEEPICRPSTNEEPSLGTCDLSMQVQLKPTASQRSFRIQLPPDTSSYSFQVELPPATSNFTIHVERAPARPLNNSTTPNRPSLHTATAMSVTKGQRASIVQTQTTSTSQASFTDPEEVKHRIRKARYLRDVPSSPETCKSPIRARLSTPVQRCNEEIYQRPVPNSEEASSNQELEADISEYFGRSVIDAAPSPRTFNLPIRVRLPPAQPVDDNRTSQEISTRQAVPCPFLIPRVDSSECSDSAYETVGPASSSDESDFYSVTDKDEILSSSGYYASGETSESNDDTTNEQESEDSRQSSSVDSEHGGASINLKARLDEVNAQIESYKLAPKCLETEENLVRESKRLLADIHTSWLELHRNRASN